MNVPSVLGASFASGVLALTLYAASDKSQPGRKGKDAPTAAPKPTLPRGTPADQVQALIKQHEKAMAAFLKRVEAAETEEEQQKLEPFFPDPGPYTQLLMQIAEDNPKDPAAVDALVWSFRNGGKTGVKAKAILIRDHLLSPQIGPLCLQLRHEWRDAGTVAILRRVLSENPSAEAKAHAAIGLALLLKQRAEWARRLQTAHPKSLPKWEKELGKDILAYLKAGDAAALEKETEELLERTRTNSDFAATTIPYGDGRIKLGDLAGQELFEMRHLQPGKPAPEISGEDIDGKPMKLSDFRGKVVLLDFWGHW